MAENGVIIYMSRMRDVPLLYRSLSMLGWNFKHIQEYPIVVFHDDIDKGTIANLMVELHKNLGFIPNLKFERLDFVTPEWVSEDSAKYTVPLDQAWMGYRHMCRYHSGGIYRDTRLLKYDYYWRLDSDSYIYSPINYDPFEYMAKNDKEYAFMATEDGEVPSVAEGLWDETERFMKTHNIPMTKDLEDSMVDGKWSCRLFYTNFEIAKFSFFRSEKYMAYFDQLDQTGNIFYKRWGDAPIHWLGVKMLLDPSKVWAVNDITYQHNAWIRNMSALPNKEIPEKIMNLVDGNLQHRYSRLERITFGLNRYRAGGPDWLNWGE
jgi:hypothetical protein